MKRVRACWNMRENQLAADEHGSTPMKTTALLACSCFNLRAKIVFDKFLLATLAGLGWDHAARVGISVGAESFLKPLVCR